jgi:hypothetical protein
MTEQERNKMVARAFFDALSRSDVPATVTFDSMTPRRRRALVEQLSELTGRPLDA